MGNRGVGNYERVSLSFLFEAKEFLVPFSIFMVCSGQNDIKILYLAFFNRYSMGYAKGVAHISLSVAGL